MLLECACCVSYRSKWRNEKVSDFCSLFFIVKIIFIRRVREGMRRVIRNSRLFDYYGLPWILLCSHREQPRKF